MTRIQLLITLIRQDGRCYSPINIECTSDKCIFNNNPFCSMERHYIDKQVSKKLIALQELSKYTEEEIFEEML